MPSLSFLLCAFASVSLAKPLLKLSSTSPAGYDTSDPSVLGPTNANCERKTYSIDVTANNSLFTTEQNPDGTALTSYLQLFMGSFPYSSNFSERYQSGGATKSVSATYSISGTWCSPQSGADDSVVQLLVHGIGFDSSYWNFGGPGIPSNHSYVEWAAAAGYNTFRYDRLGTGLSEHPEDAYNIVQAPTDAAIAMKIISMISTGDIGGHSGIKVIGIGHSYGSAQLNYVTSVAPELLAGVVLTGFTFNATAAPLYLTSAAYTTAYEVAPARFSSSDLSSAYLLTLAPQTGQLNFLYYPHYTTASAKRARDTEQPVAQGVLFTFADIIGPAIDFTGFVYIVTGDKDWIFCMANCYAVPQGSTQTSILDFVGAGYPKASSFSTSIPANTGHGISAHTSAPETYKQIQAYLKAL
ncbi:hypothetical protein FRB94_008310 [Tulasnella sp. JGI-2019a]|nr:hypothetical protein FRB93_007004 [Tulasnella sp. JGI-2019a]KAG9011479.1 hypothetical protein FRB94_008310 [Tulasnella sp. JGI-2019a]KAG9033691.1 hypothetical protein FRB95_014480 [Tulasnella sp. JGI-2019a]